MGINPDDLPSQYKRQVEMRLHGRAIRLPASNVEQRIKRELQGPPKDKARPEKSVSNRFRIRVVSYRYRLCDPDGPCSKWLVDCLKRSGIITDDCSKFIESVSFEQTQVYKSKKESEKTVLELIEIKTK